MPPEVTLPAMSPAEDAAGHAESAGAAIAFSGILGGIYLALQAMGLAPSDGFIGPRALLLISGICLTMGVVMIRRAK